jgi:hypothetical protein
MSRLITLLFGAALGAAAVYFLRQRADHAEGAVAPAWPSTPAPAPAAAPKADFSADIQTGVENPPHATPAPAAERPQGIVPERRY